MLGSPRQQFIRAHRNTQRSGTATPRDAPTVDMKTYNINNETVRSRAQLDPPLCTVDPRRRRGAG